MIREKKTGKERILSINGDLQKIISEAYKTIQPESDFVFTNKKGNVMSTQYINRKLKEFKVLYKLNIDNISTHTFRKSFGREYWKRNGYSDKALIILSEIFSHSSIATTKRYLGIKEQELMEAYEVLTLRSFIRIVHFIYLINLSTMNNSTSYFFIHTIFQMGNVNVDNLLHYDDYADFITALNSKIHEINDSLYRNYNDAYHYAMHPIMINGEGEIILNGYETSRMQIAK